jgi:hypothetical protein
VPLTLLALASVGLDDNSQLRHHASVLTVLPRTLIVSWTARHVNEMHDENDDTSEDFMNELEIGISRMIP